MARREMVGSKYVQFRVPRRQFQLLRQLVTAHGETLESYMNKVVEQLVTGELRPSGLEEPVVLELEASPSTR